MCGAEKQLQRVHAHEGVVGRQKSQWTDFSQNSGIYIVYNSHVTCSNSSFSLTMVMPRLTSLLSIGYVVYSPLATCPSPLLWADASATITEFNHVHRSRWYSDNHLVDIIFGWMQLSQHLPIHNTCGHDEISAITLLILSPAGCSCLNIRWYTAPVAMMTFQWSRQSYQCICQQHLLYSHFINSITDDNQLNGGHPNHTLSFLLTFWVQVWDEMIAGHKVLFLYILINVISFTLSFVVLDFFPIILFQK